MNCEKCSELLIEYLEGESSSQRQAEIKNHLAGCPECALELEHYMEIRAAAQRETTPEVSAEVLSSLSEAAKKSVSKKKTPFWKKWSYSPILVPTISAAIALSVWFYYGETGFENADMTNREVAAVRMKPLNDRAEEYAGSEEDEMAKIEKFQDEEDTLGAAVTEELQKPPAESRIAASPSNDEPAAPESAPQESKLEEREVTEQDKVTYRDWTVSQSNASRIDSKNIETSEDELKAVNPILPDYGGDLNLAQRQQAEGDCGASIKTNKALLGSSPAPPGYIQAASYKSLAECYEKTGDTENAAISYNRLAEVDPSQTELVNEKLAELKLEPAKMNIESKDKAKEPAN